MQPKKTRGLDAALAALAMLVATGAPAFGQTQSEAPTAAERPATRELLKSLRGGGYVLYMRHANTDTSKPDAFPKVDLNDCATQRNLNDEGRRIAATIGKQIRAAGIPVGEVIHSPFCRTRETAQLAFGVPGVRLREEHNLSYTSNMTTEEKRPVLAVTRQLLSEPVAAGTNRVIVGHAQNLAELVDRFLKPEAAMMVFRPQADGRFEYEASIPPCAWPDLLK